MPWRDWICCLVTALEEDELERYERFKLAGGEDKHWKWQWQPTGGPLAVTPSKGNIAEQIVGRWQSLTPGAHGRPGELVKGSLEEAADRGFVKRAAQTKDGKFLDEHGNEIDVPDGYFWVPKPASD